MEEFFLYANILNPKDPKIEYLKQKEWEKIFNISIYSKKSFKNTQKSAKKERKLLF